MSGPVMETSAHGSCCLGGREEATHLSQEDTHTHELEHHRWGVVGFHQALMTTQAAQQPRTPRAAQLRDSAQAEPYENHHVQSAPEALTTESVEPRTRRGCTRFSWSGPLPSVLPLPLLIG
jgi:hypothetical protein